MLTVTPLGRYVLLKLVQKFGKPERYDYMYHIAGPDKGKPKGYCFVTYPTREVSSKIVCFFVCLCMYALIRKVVSV